MGNKATKFEPTPPNHPLHHDDSPLSSLRKSNNNTTRSSLLLRSNGNIASTTRGNRPGLTTSRSQPTLVRFREDNNHTDDEEDSSDDEENKNRQNYETLKRKTPQSASSSSSQPGAGRRNIIDNSSSPSASSSTSSPAASTTRNKRRSILLFLGRNDEYQQQQQEQNGGMQYLGNDIIMSDKVMDRSTELNESFLRQMKRRTLNLGSALFNRKLGSTNSPSSSKVLSPPTALNSSTVSVLAQMPLSDDDSDMEETTPKTPTNNRLSLVIENVPTVSSPNSSPTTTGNRQSVNYSATSPSLGSTSPNSKQLNSPGNRKSQLLLNLVMMGRRNVKNVEESNENLNQKTIVELIQMENENMSRTPPSPSGSSSNSSSSMTSIQMTFSQLQSNNNKIPSPTPLHSTTSSSNLTRQRSQLSSRRRSIGAFVFEPLRFNKFSNRSISPNVTNNINTPPNNNSNSSKTTITNDATTNNSTSLQTLPTNTTRNTSPSTSTSINTSSPNNIKNTSANNLLTINFPSHATLTPTTSQNSISPLSPRSPRSPIDRTLGESRIELRKKVFSVRLENKEGSNSSLVSLAFNGKAIEESSHSHHQQEVVKDQEDAEIDHASLIDYKFHFLFSMSTTEGLIDKQLDLEDLENSSISGNIETDSHRLNESMIFLSSASNFHDRNSRKASYIKGLQTIFEKLYKTQMNLNENHVEDFEIHQQDRDTFKMTLMLGIPHLADKMIKSELDQVLQFNGEYETYVEKKRKEKRDLTIALQKMVPNTTEYDFTKGKIDNFLILKREEFFLSGTDTESNSNKVSSKDNSSNNLLIDTSNVFRIDRIDSTSNFISEKERVLIEQDQIKLKHPIKLFILFTTNNNQITNTPNVPGTFVNSKFFIKLLSKIGKITGLLPQFGFLHMSLIVSSMRFDWLDSELCVPKTKLKSMRAIACVEVGSVDNFSDLKKVTKIMGAKISFWNRNIHYCRGIGYHYNTSTVEEKANHQGSCHQFVFDLLDSLSSDITLVSEKPSIIGMHDLLKDDLLLGKKGCIGSYLDWCANNLVKDSPQLDNSEWCRIELGETIRKQFAPLLRNKINQLSSQMIIDEEEDDSRENQLMSYNKTLNLILFGNSFISSQKKRKSRALSIGMIKSPTSPSTPFSEDSPRKKKKSDSISSGTVVICFPTHSSLDEFVRDMVEVSREETKPFNITPEFYLLKSFDRALWLRNNFDKNRICRDMDHTKLPTHEFLVGDNRKRIIQGKDPLTSLDYLDEVLYNDEEDSALELIKSLKNEPAKTRYPKNSNVKASLPTMKCLCPFGDPRRELPFIENATIPTD